MHNNKLITDSSEKAELFNNFFGSIATKLAAELPVSQQDPMTFMSNHNNNMMPAPQTTMQEVIAIIKTLKSKKCSVLDFSPSIIKDNAHLLAQPLVHLFNQSINQGTFPNQLKHALIVPIFKKGSKTNTNNYRPISLLNIFSKIFEKLMKKHLVNFLDHNNTISPNQFGFQKGKGTVDALTKFSTFLYENLDKSNFVLSI